MIQVMARDVEPTVSRSVAAGHPLQENPIILKAPLSSSPSSPGKLELAG